MPDSSDPLQNTVSSGIPMDIPESPPEPMMPFAPTSPPAAPPPISDNLVIPSADAEAPPPPEHPVVPETKPEEPTPAAPPPNNAKPRKKMPVAAVVGIILLVLTLPLGLFVATNPHMIANIGSFARYSPDALIRQRERQGGCTGSACLAPELTRAAQLRATTTVKPSVTVKPTLSTSQYADCLRNSRGIPSLVAGCNDSAGGNATTGNQIVGQEVTTATTKSSCDAAGGTFIDNKTCYKNYQLAVYQAAAALQVPQVTGKACNLYYTNDYGTLYGGDPCGSGWHCNNTSSAGGNCVPNASPIPTGPSDCKNTLPPNCGKDKFAACESNAWYCVSKTNTSNPYICAKYLLCPEGWSCTGDVVPGTAGTSFASKYCVQNAPTGGSGGGGGTTTKKPPKEPTPTTAPQCVNIVVYDDQGNALSASELAGLEVGQTITFAYAPGGKSTKARFRLTDNGTWHATTTRYTKNNAQFAWEYKIDGEVTNFSIGAQWFDGTSWHN